MSADEGEAVSHADTIHRKLTQLAVAYPGPQDANEEHAALDALLAENQQLRDTLADAPFPVAAQSLSADAWDDAYEEWWNASRAAVRVEEAQ